MRAGKAFVFWPLVSVLLLADCTTKQVAAERLEPEHVPHEVIGDVVRFTLAYNQGASFSVSLGEHSRWILAALALGVLGVLMMQYRRAASHDRTLALALALIVAGASGNLLDRLRSPRGVVVQQVAVLLAHRDAPGRVEDDDVGAAPLECGDVLPCQPLRRATVPGVRVERTAAPLPRCGLERPSVLHERARGRAVHVGEEAFHHAAGAHGRRAACPVAARGPGA